MRFKKYSNASRILVCNMQPKFPFDAVALQDLSISIKSEVERIKSVHLCITLIIETSH